MYFKAHNEQVYIILADILVYLSQEPANAGTQQLLSELKCYRMLGSVGTL